MITIEGTNNRAVCYTPALDEKSKTQIQGLCDIAEFADSTIRIMPDVHAGKGCTIGTTMTITDKIVPAMVGVDIGCGMETIHIDAKELDLEQLDKCVHRFIPAGFEVRKKIHEFADGIDLSMLRCSNNVKVDYAYKSIGTLGGGNHFIEVDRNDMGDLYLVVHSGSRHLGHQVAQYYQEEAYKSLCGNDKIQLNELIKQMKAQQRESEIEQAIKDVKSQTKSPVPKEFAYVHGALFDDYIHDMRIVQHFAVLNRKAMINVIMIGMRLSSLEEFTTIHNYIDTDNMILRKGSVSAQNGEKLLIPINMRDGSLICKGKGNRDWNFSAPHGAGRLMSRNEAFKKLSMEKYQSEMNGIYSSCISKNTLDESPEAYKPMDEIVAQIEPTVEITERIKPIYNFKANEGTRKRK